MRLTLSPNLANVLSKIERSSYTVLSRCWLHFILTDQSFLSGDAASQRTIRLIATIKYVLVAHPHNSNPKRFGVSADGRTYTNARGETGRVDYARNYNPSKGQRFRGAYDKDGNYADID